MSSKKERNASIILLDMNTEKEFLEKAQETLLNICASKWFGASKDCTKIILLNTEETCNTFEEKFGKCPHIYEATDVINYTPKLINAFIRGVEPGNSDWVLGLAVALEAIRNSYYQTNGITTLQLLLITDFSLQPKLREKRIQFVIDELNAMDVYLYILGPEVKIPNMLRTFDDIRKWSNNVEYLVDEETNPNLVVAKQIVQKSKGIICGLDVGEQLFLSYVNNRILQPWKVPLTIGSKLVINCSTGRFLRKLTPPRIKAVVQDGACEPWKWHMVEDVNVDVPYTNVIGGIFKHNKFVPLPKDVEQNFKYVGERTYGIIGFTNIDNIPEFYMQGNGASCVSNDGSRLFDLLLSILVQQNKCAIAKRVYMKNCKPKLVALLPQPSEGVFLQVELPYKEFVNATYIEQNLNRAIKLDKQDPCVDAVYNYLKKLDINDPNNNDKKGSARWPLSPELMTDIRLSCIWKRILKKFLDEDTEITNNPDVVLPCYVEDIQKLKQFIPAQDLDI